MIDWNPYLESISQKYAQWWMTYTLTDVAGKTRPPKTAPLLTDLRVQTIAPPRANREENEEKTKRLPVLEGLQKYAPAHVLLRGRPGSGKSTALARLLFEKAEESKSLLANNPNPSEKIQIPILVELRRYKTSIFALIRKFLQRNELEIDKNTLRNFLRGKNPIIPLLLFDGINELPSGEARYDLQEFRQDHAGIPMIFTTRDLAIGGELNIEKKLEILPLTEEQMREFVRAYLPENGERMLTQLGNRLREFGKTPLLLWMLCWGFEDKKQIPANLGLVFRDFTENFDRYKREREAVQISDDLRRFYDRLLQNLAWMMTKGEKENLTEIKLSISKRKAQDILIDFLQPNKVSCPDITALEWLEELLKYYLIQVTPDKRGIEFPHQLIQEYYTAEALLQELPRLTDEALQWDYLNYLKWTEPIALMLGMVDKKADAIRVVKLALALDVKLGARLAGEVKAEWQAETVPLILKLNLPIIFIFELLVITRSDFVILLFLETLENFNKYIRCKSAEALGKIGSELAIPGLLKALDDPDRDVRVNAAEALGKIGSKLAIPRLIETLDDPDRDVRVNAAEALGKIGSKLAIPRLIETLDDPDRDVSWKTARALGKIGSEEAILKLLRALEHPDRDIREKAVEALGAIGSEAVIPNLLKALDDPDQDVRWKAVYALGEIRSEAAILGVIKALEHSDKGVRESAAFVLGEIGSEVAIPDLLKALDDSDWSVRGNAVEALGQIGSEEVIPSLLKALDDTDGEIYIRGNAAFALGQIGSEEAIPSLLKALDDADEYIRRNAAFALGQIGSEEAIPSLLKALDDADEYVRGNAVEALGQIGSELVIPRLLKALDDLDGYVRGSAAFALGQIGSEVVSSRLCKALDDSDGYVRRNAALALGQIGTEVALIALFNALDNPNFAISNDGDTFYESYRAISTIQNKLKYYRPISESISSSPQPLQPSSTSITYYVYNDFKEATIGNVAHIVQGNQQNFSSQPNDTQQQEDRS